LDAVRRSLKLLASEPDSSVNIVAVDFLTNLEDGIR